MEGYMTAQQAATKWNVTPRQIQLWCKTGKIKGAQKWNRDWVIPDNAERPPIKHKRRLIDNND